MVFGINTTCDISELSQISLTQRLVKLRIIILKYHSWYLCQISLQIMLLPILIRPSKLRICQHSQTQHLNLLVSHMGHHISQIKLTFMIESVFLVGNYIHPPPPPPPNLNPPWLMEHFCTFFITDKDNFLSFQS